MSDPKQWAAKSSDLLLAYFMCIFEYMYATEKGVSDIILEQLQENMLIKTRENKFLPLNTKENYFHLTGTYWHQADLHGLSLDKDKFHFISDDYYKEYQSETIFQNKNLFKRFQNFLIDLNINPFLRVERKKIRKFIQERVFHLSSILFSIFECRSITWNAMGTMVRWYRNAPTRTIRYRRPYVSRIY